MKKQERKISFADFKQIRFFKGRVIMHLKLNFHYNCFPFSSLVLLHWQQGKYHNYLTKLICTQEKLRGRVYHLGI